VLSSWKGARAFAFRPSSRFWGVSGVVKSESGEFNQGLEGVLGVVCTVTYSGFEELISDDPVGGFVQV
jgi:hypothetical protein